MRRIEELSCHTYFLITLLKCFFRFHENQYARPFFLEFFICFLMHPPVSRVHIRDMRLRDFIDHDEMLQNIFNYDMRDCRFGYNLQCFELGAYPFGR